MGRNFMSLRDIAWMDVPKTRSHSILRVTVRTAGHNGRRVCTTSELNERTKTNLRAVCSAALTESNSPLSRAVTAVCDRYQAVATGSARHRAVALAVSAIELSWSSHIEPFVLAVAYIVAVALPTHNHVFNSIGISFSLRLADDVWVKWQSVRLWLWLLQRQHPQNRCCWRDHHHPASTDVDRVLQNCVWPAHHIRLELHLPIRHSHLPHRFRHLRQRYHIPCRSYRWCHSRNGY